jgi:glycosyltransferase involved in cell wall biosynthesis
MVTDEAGLSINWVGFHGRSADLAGELGIDAVWVTGSRGWRVTRYVRQWRETRAILKARSPTFIVLMQPPVIALWSVLTYLRRTGALLVADLHTGVFTDPKWRWAARIVVRAVRRHGFAIVTNEALASTVRNGGARVMVLHDRIERRELDESAPFEDGRLAERLAAGFVLAPLSYAHDEPLRELLAAAAALPRVQWVLTGRPPGWVRRAAPPNMIFPGFVSSTDYWALMARAAVVLAPTRDENTMQRAGYEALCAGKALVTARTAVLTEYFDGAAVLSGPEASDWSAAVRSGLARRRELQRSMLMLRQRRIKEQASGLVELRAMIRTSDASQAR